MSDANRLPMLSYLTGAAVLAGASAEALAGLDRLLTPYDGLWVVQH